MIDKNRTKKLHDTYPVGAIVTTGIDVLSTKKGGIGVVYENYKGGCSIIFEDGCYDGFSEQCLEICEINVIGFCPSVKDYQFSHVGKLSDDFRNGRFSVAFQKIKRY